MLKFFTPDEQLSFASEAQANLRLMERGRYHDRLIMMNDIGEFEARPSVTLYGTTFYWYSYIVLPFAEYGSLLEVYMRAIERGHNISMSLKLYFFR